MTVISKAKVSLSLLYYRFYDTRAGKYIIKFPVCYLLYKLTELEEKKERERLQKNIEDIEKDKLINTDHRNLILPYLKN